MSDKFLLDYAFFMLLTLGVFLFMAFAAIVTGVIWYFVEKRKKQ